MEYYASLIKKGTHMDLLYNLLFGSGKRVEIFPDIFFVLREHMRVTTDYDNIEIEHKRRELFEAASSTEKTFVIVNYHPKARVIYALADKKDLHPEEYTEIEGKYYRVTREGNRTITRELENMVEVEIKRIKWASIVIKSYMGRGKIREYYQGKVWNSGSV